MESTDGVHGLPDGAPQPSEPTTPPAEAAPTPAAEPTHPPAPAVPVAPTSIESPSESTPADDLAPDASEPGDPLPAELSGSVHEGEIVPDNVDQPDTQPGASQPQDQEQDQA